VAGAAANQPLAGPAPGGGSSRGLNTREDETKNYEISKTTTHTITRGSRLKRLSVAVLLDATPDGKVRGEAELKRLESLAKGAVGFDAARGDQFQISSSPFNRAEQAEAEKTSILDSPRIMRIAQLVGGVILLVIAALAISKMRALASGPPRTAALAGPAGVAMLRPGARVGELEAMMSPETRALPPSSTPALPGASADPNVAVRERARDVARQDPARAAHLLKAWIDSDSEAKA
jgi:flagellar M-ring protein FliF